MFNSIIKSNIKRFSTIALNKANEVSKVFNNGELTNTANLVLKKEEDINNYILTLVKNYFRTTNKSQLGLESRLKDHGLDSLDIIELSMQLEEDLGYVISAETLPVFHKPKHFVNYISQVEKFKEQHKKSVLA